MRKSVLFITCLLFLFAAPGFGQVYEQSCSSCHADMAEKPFKLRCVPPADLLSALSTPCNDYGKIMEEYYYTHELFVTSEKLIHKLESKRMNVHSQLRALQTSRDQLRTLLAQPVVSLATFKAETGKLRYDVGKVYREVKTTYTGLSGRNVFGVLVLSTIVVIFLVVTGWQVSSGKGIVHPNREHADDMSKDEQEQKEAVKS